MGSITIMELLQVVNNASKTDSLKNRSRASARWHKGMGPKIDKNPDGSVTVRKA
jgi:hypothetical protein